MVTKRKTASKSKNKKIVKNKSINTGKIARLPIKKKAEKRVKEEGFFSKINRFFKEAKTELTKVKWPSQKELIAATIAVIILSLVFAFFLGIVDFGIIKFLKVIIQ